MSNRLFAATGAVWHSGPKRARRTWGGTLMGVLMLLALAALTGWLWTCVKHATLPAAVRLPGVAMAPLSQGLVIGALLSLTTQGIVLVVRRARRNKLDAAAEQELRWTVREPGAVLPLPPDDLRRILWAVTECVCATCDNVRKARLDLSVEDYGERLEAAEKDLRRAIKCLGDLMKHLNAAAAEGGQKA